MAWRKSRRIFGRTLFDACRGSRPCFPSQCDGRRDDGVGRDPPAERGDCGGGQGMIIAGWVGFGSPWSEFGVCRLIEKTSRANVLTLRLRSARIRFDGANGEAVGGGAPTASRFASLQGLEPSAGTGDSPAMLRVPSLRSTVRLLVNRGERRHAD